VFAELSPRQAVGFNVKQIFGKGDLGITEYTITYQGRPRLASSQARPVSVEKTERGDGSIGLS